LLLGSDVTFSLGKWENIETLLNTMQLAVGLRVGESAQMMTDLLDALSDERRLSIEYKLIGTTYRTHTSSRVREDAHHHLVPATVADYIRANGLYS
jgi:nicotinic acid mononucleotide adenylyltransferase